MYTVQINTTIHATKEVKIGKLIPFNSFNGAVSYACPFMRGRPSLHRSYNVVIRNAEGEKVSYYSKG